MELIKDNILPQLDKFVEQDKERDLLLRILIKTIDEKEDQVRKLNYELEHERDSRLRYQHKKKDPFVTVLVDGDGAIFRNEFYDNPAHGAQKASVALQQEVRSHLKKTQLDADDVPILVRIFANLHGLAGKMRSLDIIESDKDMRIFAEYFNKSRAEFDMVDVGSGKENADAKMRKTLAQSIKNFQCRKIFFAGCHDAGYMHDLAEYQGDESNKSRIILLETTPAHHSFCEMGYEIVQFDRVFRSLPLESALKQVSSPTSPQTIQPISQEATSLANHGALPANSPQILLPFEAENLISQARSGTPSTIQTAQLSPTPRLGLPAAIKTYLSSRTPQLH
uniref:Histone-lysine N-methyltransferase SETD1B n=1 Tax=Talaromyces marneffei PM1 TaxID=1077442 RepID=A0A093V5V3_TALMA